MAADPDSRVKDVLDDILTLVGTGPTGLAGRLAVAESGPNLNLASGMVTITRESATLASSVGLPNASMRMVYFSAPKSFTCSQIRVFSGGTAAAATPTLVRFGLYSIAANGDGTLVGSTPNDTTLLATINTAYTKSLSVAAPITAGARYALAGLVVSGAATPTLVGSPLLATAPGTDFALAPRLTGVLSSQSDLPGSYLESALIATPLSGRFYALLLP